MIPARWLAVVIGSISLSGLASAQDLVVSVPADFPTIQAALDDVGAAPHDQAIVRIAAGHYAEDLSCSSVHNIELWGFGSVTIGTDTAATPAIDMQGCSGIVFRKLHLHGDLSLGSTDSVAIANTTVAGALVANDCAGLDVSASHFDGLSIVASLACRFVTSTFKTSLDLGDADLVDLVDCKLNVTEFEVTNATNLSLDSCKLTIGDSNLRGQHITIRNCTIKPQSPTGDFVLGIHGAVDLRLLHDDISIGIATLPVVTDGPALSDSIISGNTFRKYLSSPVTGNWSGCTIANNTWITFLEVIESAPGTNTDDIVLNNLGPLFLDQTAGMEGNSIFVGNIH